MIQQHTTTHSKRNDTGNKVTANVKRSSGIACDAKQQGKKIIGRKE